MAWGAGDHEIAVGPVDTDADEPKMGEWRVRIKDDKNKIPGDEFKFARTFIASTSVSKDTKYTVSSNMTGFPSRGPTILKFSFLYMPQMAIFHGLKA